MPQELPGGQDHNPWLLQGTEYFARIKGCSPYVGGALYFRNFRVGDGVLFGLQHGMRLLPKQEDQPWRSREIHIDGAPRGDIL